MYSTFSKVTKNIPKDDNMPDLMYCSHLGIVQTETRSCRACRKLGASCPKPEGERLSCSYKFGGFDKTYKCTLNSHVTDIGKALLVQPRDEPHHSLWKGKVEKSVFRIVTPSWLPCGMVTYVRRQGTNVGVGGQAPPAAAMDPPVCVSSWKGSGEEMELSLY